MDQGAAMVQNMISQQIQKTAEVMEQQLDDEIAKLDRMDDDDLERMRRERLQGMKKMQEQKRNWLAQGHGKYEELPGEESFFKVGKASKNVVVHFYKDDTFRCKIFDKHLEKLAPKHIECRFVKLDVMKAPFLTERLKIKVIPSLMVVKNEKTCDYVVGFDDLGGVDDFSTEMLEWRLGQSEVIKYSGDLMTPPDQPGAKKKSIMFAGKKQKIIRGGANDDDSSDDDD